MPAVILVYGRRPITRNAAHVLQLHYQNLIYNKKRRRDLCFPRPIQPFNLARQSLEEGPVTLNKKDAPEASWLLRCVAAFVTSDSIVYRTQGTMTCHFNGGGRGRGDGGRGGGGGRGSFTVHDFTPLFGKFLASATTRYSIYAQSQVD